MKYVMRILYVYPALATQGGVERILIDKMNRLVGQEGYVVHVVTYNQGDHPLAFELDGLVHHVDLQVRTHVQYYYGGIRRIWEGWKRSHWLHSRMKRVMKEIMPDVIVTTTSCELTLLNRLRGKIPMVVESHGGYDHLIDYERMTLAHRWDVRCRYRQLRKVNAIVAITNSDAERWKNRYPNVRVIPNLVHLNPSGNYASCQNKRIIFVGRFAYQKGISDLMAVWQLVHSRYPDWQLHMYGSGDERLMQGQSGISVHQPSSNIFACYCESSMLVLTSRWEPFGLVIPEAMSCGLPVVSFEGDGPSDIITDGVDGFLIGNRNVRLMADRIGQLIEQGELRRQMGRNAIQKAQHYSAENIMPMWKELFESLKKQ